MATFKKTVLLEDRDYHSPDGLLSVNPKSKKHWSDKVNEFKAAKFDIPTFWDHSSDPKKSQPIVRKDGKRRRAKGQAGWLIGAAMSKDGGLELEFDIPDKDDAQQLADNLTKVSPVIWDKLKDGRGNEHENVIGACDLVVHPVDDTQTDFKSAPAIACSLVRMNLDGKPQIYRLAEHKDMADDDSTHDSDDEESSDEDVKMTIQLLGDMKIMVPDDTTLENFHKRVHAALMTAAAMGGEETMETGTEDLEEARPEFAALSLDNKKWRGYADGEHRKNVTKRLDVILEKGQCTPPQHKKRLGELSTVRLSLDENGQHQPGVTESWIEFSESLPVGTFWDSEKRTRMSDLAVVPHPTTTTGDKVTDEEADEIVAEMNRRK